MPATDWMSRRKVSDMSFFLGFIIIAIPCLLILGVMYCVYRRTMKTLDE